MSKKQRTWKLAVSGVLALTVIAAGVFTYRYESASYKEQMDELEEQQTAEAEEKEKQEEENAAQENAAEEEPETADASTDSVDAVTGDETAAEQQPDLIFITGDMINQDEENTEILCTLLEQLTAIAPVYYGFGNHERNWECGTQKELKDKIAQTGAIVLDCEYKDVTVKGQELRIGGYYGYYRQPGMLTKSEAQREKELAFADEFEDTDRIKILLCHIPTAWLDWEYIDKFPVDLVFCGHYHGGQIRLPLIGGLYAPNVGWFPEYTKGIFQGSEATCVLSAGLGNETWVPRVNNLPEIVVADLVKENP